MNDGNYQGRYLNSATAEKPDSYMDQPSSPLDVSSFSRDSSSKLVSVVNADPSATSPSVDLIYDLDRQKRIGQNLPSSSADQYRHNFEMAAYGAILDFFTALANVYNNEVMGRLGGYSAGPAMAGQNVMQPSASGTPAVSAKK